MPTFGDLRKLKGCMLGLTFLFAMSSALPAQLLITGPTQVRLGATGQYTAMFGGAAVAAAWSVNGFPGGTGSTGSISASGLYMPAATIFAGHSVTITATASGSSGTLAVKILNPLPAISSGSVTQAATGTLYSLDVQGSGFISTSQLQVAGSNVTMNLLSSSELQSTVTVPSGATTVTIGVLNPNAGQSTAVTRTLTVSTIPPVSLTQAARLLDQTSFGPTLASVQQVQQLGVVGYLNQQFLTPTTLIPPIPNPPVALCPPGTDVCAQHYFWRNALTAPDQLRQRVAFALSEIFVVSTGEVNARTIPSYHNMLARDAFGNFSQLLRDVALSPAMGAYLDMLNSPAPAAGQIADENFGRELMQLFSTGLYQLNSDGSLQLDGQGNPQPVYTEAIVQANARAFTGWTYANPAGGTPTSFPNGVPNYDQPLQPIEVSHDQTAKQLLGGVALPGGQTAAQDLAGVVSSVFQHPNVGPFIGRQLIQHLVTSNPSPAYVQRVAAVFANNGAGVRGDMKTVISAIVLDPEARAADTSPEADGGHLREPILYFTAIMRGLQFTSTNSQGRYDAASNYTAPLGQVPYKAGSVFNFFSPAYVIPGTALNAPEFGLANTATSMARLNLADSIVRNHLTSFNIDMSQSSFLGQIASATGNPAADSTNLVTALNIVFAHNQMPSNMSSAIASNAALLSDIGQRVRVATWLVISSNLFQMEH
jgi:uncharacterized protein (DUF1800 family)